MSKKTPPIEKQFDERKAGIKQAIAAAYIYLNALDDLFDLLKVQDKKYDENSYKVNMVRTVIFEHRAHIYSLEQLYNTINIIEKVITQPDTEDNG